MKIAIGSDHAGFQLKQELIGYLKNNGYDYQDFGTDSKAWLRWYQTWNQPATKPTGQG